MEEPSLLKPCIHPFDSSEESLSVQSNSPAGEKNSSIERNSAIGGVSVSSVVDSGDTKTAVQDGTAITYLEKVALDLPAGGSDILDDIPVIGDYPVSSHEKPDTSESFDEPACIEKGDVGAGANRFLHNRESRQPVLDPAEDRQIDTAVEDIEQQEMRDADAGTSTLVESKMLPTIPASAVETEAIGDDAPSPAITADSAHGCMSPITENCEVISEDKSESSAILGSPTSASVVVGGGDKRDSSPEVVTPHSTTGDAATSICEGGTLVNDSESCTSPVTRDASAAEPVVTSEAAVSPRTPVPSNDLVSDTNGVCETMPESDKSVSTLAITSSDSHASPMIASIADVHTLTPPVESAPVSMIQCRMCALRLRDQDLMVSHISAKHNVDVWYACPYCQLGCSPQRANIVRHIQKSHASQPTEVPINIVNSDKYFFASPTNVTSMEVTTTTTLDGGIRSTADTTAVLSDLTSSHGTPDSMAMSVDGSNEGRHTAGTLTAVPRDKYSGTLDTETNPVADDDDIIFVAEKPGSKRRLVAVPGAPGVTSSMSGVAMSSLQTSLQRPMNVTTSLRHPIMSSVPTMRPAHVNHNNMIPTNTYNAPPGNTAPMTSPARPSQYHAHGIPPAHMNNVMSTVGAQARPAHANHVPPILRRGPPPLIPLTMLEASRMAEIPRQLTPMQHAALRSLPQAVGVSAQRVHPPRPPSVINIADEDDEEDSALKQSFSVFNLRPRLRTSSIVYRAPGGTDLRRSIQAVRAAPPPYAQRHMSALTNRPPPTAHQFAPIATPTYNGTHGASKRCPHCTFATVSLSALHDHIVSHGSIVRWACPYCAVPPQSGKEVIARHIQTQHPRFPVVYKPVGL